MLFSIASALILAVIVYARRYVDPLDSISWAYQVLALCLLVVAIAGRALVGYRPRQGAAPGLVLPGPALLAIVAAAAVLPYLQTLRVGLLSDDYGLLAAVRAAKTPWEAARSDAFVTFYRPLTVLVWWLGDRLWHGNPVCYHALSLALHALNALLLYGLGRRLTGSAYAALAAALLFAAHPTHVEPVTWLAASSDLLSTAFSLTSLLLLERGLGAGSPARSRPALAGALLAFLLALLSKEAALALPGFVVLRLALIRGPSPDRRVYSLGAAYAAVLVAYLALRSVALGGVGGYHMPLSFWNSFYPSAPMLMLGDYLFPVHRTLFSAFLGPARSLVVLCLMGLGALWWVRGLERVPGRRLWLWLGFFLLTAVPTWVFLWQPSSSLEWTRFAYLPTIGLALLFGDLCAGSGSRRSSAAAGAIVIGLAALTIWYVTPWRQAGRLSAAAVTSGARLVNELSADEPPPVLYVTDLPDAWYGAPVLANCYPQALSLAVGHPLAVFVVSARHDRALIHPETMANSRLAANEYLVRWDPQQQDLLVVRRGGGHP